MTTPPLPRASDQATELTLWNAHMDECTHGDTVPRRAMYTASYRAAHRAGWLERAAIAHSAAQAPAADPIGVAVEWPNGHIDLVRGNDNNRATSDEAWEALIAYLDSRAADGQQGASRAALGELCLNLRAEVLAAVRHLAECEHEDAQNRGKGGPGVFKKVEAAQARVVVAVDAIAAIARAPLPAQAGAVDLVVEVNRQLLLDRSRVGIVKYGAPLGEAGLPVLEWQFRIPPGTDYGSKEHIGAMKAEIADLRAQFARQSAPEGAPVGMVLVPVEPTPEMIAAMHFKGDVAIAIGHAQFYEDAVEDYAAMLAAAPSNQSPAEEA